MDATVLVGLISALAALLGAFIGTLPSILQQRIRLRELEEQRSTRIHEQSLALTQSYAERIKLLEVDKGVYSSHDPPLFRYWVYYQAMKQLEGGVNELSPEIKKIIAHDFELLGRDPKEYGLDIAE
jgi:hypothetical protein